MALPANWQILEKDAPKRQTKHVATGKLFFLDSEWELLHIFLFFPGKMLNLLCFKPFGRAGGSLTTTECGHLRPQTPVKDSGSLMTTKCGHLRPQNLIFTDRANKTSTVHGVTCDHRMRSLTTTKHFHNRATEGGGVGGMITYLGLHTDTPKGGLVYRLWACTHAGPFWWVGVGWVG